MSGIEYHIPVDKGNGYEVEFRQLTMAELKYVLLFLNTTQRDELLKEVNTLFGHTVRRKPEAMNPWK